MASGSAQNVAAISFLLPSSRISFFTVSRQQSSVPPAPDCALELPDRGLVAFSARRSPAGWKAYLLQACKFFWMMVRRARRDCFGLIPPSAAAVNSKITCDHFLHTRENHLATPAKMVRYLRFGGGVWGWAMLECAFPFVEINMLPVIQPAQHFSCRR